MKPQGKHPAQRVTERLLKHFPITVSWALGEVGGKDRNWHSACYLPSAALINYAVDTEPPQRQETFREMLALQSILSWRATQGIYRFDPDLYREIAATPLTSTLPVEAFFTLPAWGLYIELQDGRFAGRVVDGVFISLSDDSASEGYGLELRLVFVAGRGDSIVSFPLPLTGGTIGDCLDALQVSGVHSLQKHLGREAAGTISPLREDADFVADLARCLSLVLYLCSEEPDTPAPRARPLPRRDKRGAVIVEAVQPKVWDVGLRFGTQYRAWQGSHMSEGADSGHGGSVRPHVRRAHWHGYWYGKLDQAEKRTFRLRWLSPILVGDHHGELPAVVHPVKKSPLKHG